jgi:hypothetical protein
MVVFRYYMPPLEKIYKLLDKVKADRLSLDIWRENLSSFAKRRMTCQPSFTFAHGKSSLQISGPSLRGGVTSRLFAALTTVLEELLSMLISKFLIHWKE